MLGDINVVFIRVQCLDDAPLGLTSSIGFRKVNQLLFHILLPRSLHNDHLWTIHPLGIRVSLIDNSQLTGIEKDQGSNRKNANDADEDLQIAKACSGV